MTSTQNFNSGQKARKGIDLEFRGHGVEEIGVDTKTGKTLVRVNPHYFRPTEVEELLGNPAKAERILGWKATTKAEALCELMAKADLEKVRQCGY